LKLDPDTLIDTASKAYRAWKSQQPLDAVVPPSTSSTTTFEVATTEKEITFEQQQFALLEQYEGKAYKVD
jgi:hypothetical protein